MTTNTKADSANNYAFIDGQNLHSGVRQAGWKLDHKKFREYLREEFDITRAYIFIGYMEEQQNLYSVLQEAGFILFFKPLLRYEDGTVKGNVDAELIVQTLIEKDRYDQALIVSGDGDFSSLLRHLNGENKLKGIIIPNKFNYSSLFKRLDGFDKDLVTYIGDQKGRLAYGFSGKSRGHYKKPSLKKDPGKTPVSTSISRPPINVKPVPAATSATSSSPPKRAPKKAPAEQPNRVKSKAQLEEAMLATIEAQKPKSPVATRKKPVKETKKTKTVTKRKTTKTASKP